MNDLLERNRRGNVTFALDRPIMPDLVSSGPQGFSSVSKIRSSAVTHVQLLQAINATAEPDGNPGMGKSSALVAASTLAWLMGTPSLLAAPTPPHPSLAQIYGYVSRTGVLQPGSNGIESVTYLAPGRYCILPASATLKEAAALGTLYPQITLVNAHWTGSDAVAFAADVEPTNVSFVCPSASYIMIATGDSQGRFADEAFVVQFK